MLYLLNIILLVFFDIYNKSTKQSDHPITVHKAILMNVCKRLVKLTSIEDSGLEDEISTFYPQHTKALIHAGLMSKDNVPSMQSILKEMRNPSRREKKEARQKEFSPKQCIYFCVAYLRLWPFSIVKEILKIKENYDSLK